MSAVITSQEVAIDLELKGKRAVVTGASRGIGKQIARILIEEGARVALVARHLADLEVTALELGLSSFPVTCDTSQHASVKAMVGSVVKELGEVDILVNCAAQPGGQAPAPKLAELADQAFWDDVNIKSHGLPQLHSVQLLRGSVRVTITLTGSRRARSEADEFTVHKGRLSGRAPGTITV
jgi:NAD(P)-dependent dehydrogenase (short-subunit alcohol dehydrogenase family)